MPLVASPAPDIKLIAPAFESLSPDLTFMYYHYPDRVEVVPVVHLWESLGPLPPTAHVPLVIIRPHNLTAAPIIRLEIDGQGLELGRAIRLAPQEDDCNIDRLWAINRLAAPLKVRWQLARTAPEWQEALVTVPAFANHEPAQGSATENAVHLYFHPDGGVSAQRAQVVAVAEGSHAARLTAIVPVLKTAPACGDAAKAYTSRFMTIMK